MQRFKCKNANPKKVETRGFSRFPNPGFGFGKMSGLPGYPGFNPYGIPLCSTHRPLQNFVGIGNTFCGRVDERTLRSALLGQLTLNSEECT